MKTIRHLSMVALGLLMAACTTDDITTEQPAENGKGIPFTATLSNGGSATRVISPAGQAAWALYEHVALVYKVGNETKVTDAEVTAVSDGTDGKTEGTATITAELDADVATGTDVTLIYPYSAVNLTEGDDYGKVRDDLFKDQTGTIDYISATCDLRKGEGKITVNTNGASLKDNVTMDSQIAIWVINPRDDATGNLLEVRKLEVYFGGMTASTPYVDAGDAKSEFIMAVPAGSTGLTILATISGNIYIYNKASVTLNASTWYDSEVRMKEQNMKTITAETGELTLNDGDHVNGTGGVNTQLKIADGATVTLSGVMNNSITISDDIAGIECLGDATIVLYNESENMLKGRWNMPCIYIPLGKTLTIRGDGTLIADNSGNSGAGIGGGYYFSCGNIVIEGGNITAKGGSYAAGIGSGMEESCGNITIKGGTISANGSDNAAGIGSGYSGSCGNITILGGTITANGDDKAAGIGGGEASTSSIICGAISISGGTVTATGGKYGAGIGSGYADNYTNECGDITISGSAQVKAQGGEDAAGIGSGGTLLATSKCGAISIEGGTVEATGGDDAAGIGSGSGGKFTSISIGSGITRVTATRSNNIVDLNVPIGKGESDQGSGAVTFGGVTMHDGDDWTNRPTDGQTYGGIKVTVSNTPFDDATWTLTPKP